MQKSRGICSQNDCRIIQFIIEASQNDDKLGPAPGGAQFVKKPVTGQPVQANLVIYVSYLFFMSK